MTQPTPDAQIFITTSCPHCPTALQGLTEMVKIGVIGRLDVVNVEAHHEVASQMGVRSAPWINLGPFVLEGAQSVDHLKRWASIAYTDEGDTAYLHELLEHGRLDSAIDYVASNPVQRLSSLLPLITPDSPMQVKLGADAILEQYSGADELKGLLPELARLSQHEDARIRTDACYYLGLTGDMGAHPYLDARLEDDSPEVQEVAAESLQELATVVS